jgi:predicted TIM-barrel fold metal-dependent hydrolase
MKVIDGDSHFAEPLDLFERYIDPAYRDQAMRVAKDSVTGAPQLFVEGRPLRLLNVEELLAAVVGYGQKEAGRDLSTFDRYLISNPEWQDMDKRVRFLDEEGIDCQVIYPTLGLLWEGGVDNPYVADALCRAYNTWAFELTATHNDRLFPAAHISLRDPYLAVREMERVAKLGCRTIFVAAKPINGKSFGHPDLDPVWAAAQDLDLSIGIHLVGHAEYTGSQWYRDRDPGFMFVTMNIIQDPRMALTTMVYDGVFERFPKLRVATIEAMAGWVGEWLERLNYRYAYMKHTSQMKRSATEYFQRNIWINGDPEEKLFPLMVQFAGDDRFFTGSDYPHAEGFVHPMQKARDLLSASLPQTSVEKILGDNARIFYGI